MRIAVLIFWAIVLVTGLGLALGLLAFAGIFWAVSGLCRQAVPHRRQR